MSTLAKSFTALGSSGLFKALAGKGFSYAVSGTFSATWILEKTTNGGQTFDQVATGTGAASGTIVANEDAHYRFRCSAFTSGTMVTSIADVIDVIQQWQNQDGLVVLQITEEGIVTPKVTNSGDQTIAGNSTITGTQTAGAFALGTDIALDYVDVIVSSAEILALNATPKTLVAAPGANKILVPAFLVFFLDYNSAAYAGVAAGEDWAIKYTDSSGAIVGYLETDPFLTVTADAYRVLFIGGAAAAFLPSVIPVANAPLVLHQLSGEVITGNSPVAVRTYYRTIDLSTLLAA